MCPKGRIELFMTMQVEEIETASNQRITCKGMPSVSETTAKVRKYRREPVISTHFMAQVMTDKCRMRGRVLACQL